MADKQRLEEIKERFTKRKRKAERTSYENGWIADGALLSDIPWLIAQLEDAWREIERMREIIGGIVALANQGESVTLTEDLGENTLTICVGSAHTHCGVPDGSLDTLIDHLHALLVDGVGLSWATAAPEEGKQI